MSNFWQSTFTGNYCVSSLIMSLPLCGALVCAIQPSPRYHQTDPNLRKPEGQLGWITEHAQSLQLFPSSSWRPADHTQQSAPNCNSGWHWIFQWMEMNRLVPEAGRATVGTCAQHCHPKPAWDLSFQLWINFFIKEQQRRRRNYRGSNERCWYPSSRKKTHADFWDQ